MSELTELLRDGEIGTILAGIPWDDQVGWDTPIGPVFSGCYGVTVVGAMMTEDGRPSLTVHVHESTESAATCHNARVVQLLGTLSEMADVPGGGTSVRIV